MGQIVPGTQLGKYELLATIGQGGMASVILARQRGPGGFEKVVVVKVVHPHMAQDELAVQMLLDEARLAAAINHPNVVQTYDLGEADGTFYIAMEYLAGESLTRVLGKLARDGMIDPNLAAWIVAQAADGLHAAHELCDFNGKNIGLVHRDVSPGNIVVLYNGTVKVVDFGIAKAKGRVSSTDDGLLKGKFGYMSPEQIKNEEVDRRSDVFSLGIVLWEALALRRLFQTDNVGATLMKILKEQRVPPSRYRPGIAPELDAIALKALQNDPRKRFQTAEAMKQAIEEVIWQARIGPRTVETYMKSLFADRIESRRLLLGRATRARSLSRADLAALGTAFKDGRAVTAPAAIEDPAPEPKRRTSWLLAFLLFLLLAGGGGYFYLQYLNELDQPGADTSIKQ